MNLRTAADAAAVSFPTQTYRVHLDPGWVYQHSEPPRVEPDYEAPNRFDDPFGRFVVRYLANQLTGSMLEVLAWHRPHEPTEDRAAAIEGLDDPGFAEMPDPTSVQGVARFLGSRKVGIFRLVHGQGVPRLIDAYDPNLLSELDRLPQMQTRLRDVAVEKAHGAGQSGQAHLDQSLVRNAASDVGRRITQTMSWILLSQIHCVDGLQYTSRHDDSEVCWALRTEVPVVMDALPAPLNPTNPEHRHAVRHAARRLHVPLPSTWA